MSEVGDLLELMHGVSRRVRSVRATIVERRRPELLERAFRRFVEQTDIAAGGGYFHIPPGGAAPGEEVDEHVWRIELWAEPGRFRQERTGPDAESVLVVDGERWWDWSQAFGLHSHEDRRGVRYGGGLHLLDPAEFLVGFAIELVGESAGAGRPAKRVRVRSTAPAHPPVTLDPGIEEAELLLDAERGLILRRASLVGGEEAAVLEVEAIAYDEALPPEIFVFELPPGAPARGRAEPELTTVDGAAARASFRVFKLDPVPPDWRVQAIYIAATERPTLPDSVTLLYSRRDGGEQLQIRETTGAHQLPMVGEERRFKHNGRDYIALRPESPAGREPSELIFAVGGTQLRMSSSHLSRARLLELAGALAEA